jgi:hypothetical protein
MFFYLNNQVNSVAGIENALGRLAGKIPCLACYSIRLFGGFPYLRIYSFVMLLSILTMEFPRLFVKQVQTGESGAGPLIESIIERPYFGSRGRR